MTVKRADGSVLTYSYDGNGNQTSSTDGLGHSTTYSYDALNRVSAMTDPLGRTTSYAYDPAGNLTNLTDPQGEGIGYSYDAANEEILINYTIHLHTVMFSYNADGQRTTMMDGTGITSYTYDSLNRLTQSTSGARSTVGYSYDLKGQLTGLTYPGGQKVKRTYDAAGRLVAVSDWLGHSSTFSYDADGNLVKENSANGVQAVLGYDQNDQALSIVDSLKGKSLFSCTYTRDALEQLATQQASCGTQGKQSYGYTTLNQVSLVNQPTYQYDAGDNLTRSGSATLSYDTANELTSLVNGSATTTFGYDERGNRLTQTAPGNTVTSYSYDQVNQLTAYSAGTTTTQYSYNADGLRMSKTVNNGQPEAFTWDVAEGTPLLLQDGGTQYVTGPGGLPLEQVSGKTALFFHQDQLGSTCVLTNATGTVVATYTYDAYGNVTGKTGKASTPLQYAGQYSDAESGLIYMHARYYDPVTEQFLTRDPLVSQTQQAYGYVDGNPLNFTDPTGMQPNGGGSGCGSPPPGEACVYVGCYGTPPNTYEWSLSGGYYMPQYKIYVTCTPPGSYEWASVTSGYVSGYSGWGAGFVTRSRPVGEPMNVGVKQGGSPGVGTPVGSVGEKMRYSPSRLLWGGWLPYPDPLKAWWEWRRLQ